MFVYAPDTPILNLLFLTFTLDILYIHHSLTFALRTAKAAIKDKKYVQKYHKYSDSHRDLIMSILRRFSYANAA